MTTEPVKFLIVDDREENLLTLDALLRRDGLLLLRARSGAEALEQLLLHDVALAIIDVQMPDMNGFELAELMRGAERTKRVPIIFLTAGTERDRRFRGYEAGAVDYLFKPVEPEILRSKSDVFFELYRQRQAVARQRDELRAAAEVNARLLSERASLLESERAARAEAERQSRMKDEFLAMLSHELRTPLNAILGWSQVLAGGTLANDPEAMREGMDVITRNARAQAQLIGDLLDMSRIVSGKIRLDVKRVDVVDLLNNAVASVAHAAEAKGLSLVRSLDRDVPEIWADPGRLQQVVWNLLSNAIKFTPAGGEVRLELSRRDGAIEIRVSDTGPGIKAEFIPFLFDRFRQADASVTRKHGGLGLGLSIVKNLVDLHGGQVRAYSLGEGKGATFTVTLPLVTGAAVAPKPGGVVEGPGQPVGLGESLAGMRILVVDDEPDARALLNRVFSDYEADVTVARSAAEAWAAIQAGPFDVVVSDIGMPGEDGYSFIRKLRQLPADQGGLTPAVAFTAFARPEDRTRALAAGYQVHVTKPAEPLQLLAAVRQACAAGRAAVG